MKALRLHRDRRGWLVMILGVGFGWGQWGNTFPGLVVHPMGRLVTVTLRTRGQRFAETVWYIRLGQHISAHRGQPARIAWGVDVSSDHLVALVARFVAEPQYESVKKQWGPLRYSRDVPSPESGHPASEMVDLFGVNVGWRLS